MNQNPRGSNSRRSEQLKPFLRLLLQEGRPGTPHQAGTPFRGERPGSLAPSYGNEGRLSVTEEDVEELMDLVCSEVEIVDEVMDRLADLRLINRAWKFLEQLSCEALLEALDAHLKHKWNYLEGTELS